MDVCAAYQVPHSTFLSWPKLDRDKAIWHHLRRRGTCRSCGTHPDEWDEDKGGDRGAYAATLRRCRGCQVLQTGQELNKKAHGHGVYVTLIRREAAVEQR